MRECGLRLKLTFSYLLSSVVIDYSRILIFQKRKIKQIIFISDYIYLDYNVGKDRELLHVDLL